MPPPGETRDSKYVPAEDLQRMADSDRMDFGKQDQFTVQNLRVSGFADPTIQFLRCHSSVSWAP